MTQNEIWPHTGPVLNQLDLQILKSVRGRVRSLSQISKDCGYSSPICKRRTERLKGLGLLEVAFVAKSSSAFPEDIEMMKITEKAKRLLGGTPEMPLGSAIKEGKALGTEERHGSIPVIDDVDLTGLESNARRGRTRRTEVILLLFGLSATTMGLGAAASSWFHDWLKVPILGVAFDIFGPLNLSFAIAGLAVAATGILSLAVSQFLCERKRRLGLSKWKTP